MCTLQKKQARAKAAERFQRFQEKDYMDPKQGLCLGALFDIAATNVSSKLEKTSKKNKNRRDQLFVFITYEY